MLITKIYKPNEIDKAANELKLGELVAFPTETVYGLGADATNEKAVKRVYLAKGRPSDNPLIVTVANKEMLLRYVSKIPNDALKLMDSFWPGPLTIVLNIKEGSLPHSVTGGLKTAAFRFPDNKLTQELIEKANVAIVGPSANSSGKPSPTTAKHVFHDLEGKIAGIVDGGATEVGVESTIIDMSVAKPTILRPGAISGNQIEEVLKKQVISNKQQIKGNEIPKAPGMKYRHYAPKAQVIIIKESQLDEVLSWAKNKELVGLMMRGKALKEKLPKNVIFYDLGEDIKSASHNLFDGLRYFDDIKNISVILVEEFLEEDLGIAYMNRLKKASNNTFFNQSL